MTPGEILNKAADLLEPEGAWTQGVFSRNADGTADYGEEDEDPIVASDPVCWCALGAMAQVAGLDPLAYSTFFPGASGPTPTTLAKEALAGVLGRSVESWNDALDRTQAEVVAALREAAQRAECGR